MNKQSETAGADSDSPVSPPPLSARDTRNELLSWARRGYVVVRFVLVQKPDRGKDRVSILGELTRDRHHRALVLYLLLLTWWPWLEDRRDPLDSEVWLRALTVEGAHAGSALTWSPSTLSRTWGELEKYGLIQRQREGRLTRITPCREDGEDAYVAPAGQKKDWRNAYFTIPDEFWTGEYFATLSPSALAVLLIVLKETTQKHDVELPRAKMPTWYGISGKTVTNGIKELTEAGLMDEPRIDLVVDPAAKFGFTRHFYYGLTGPFSTQERTERRKQAHKKWHQNERKRKRAKQLAEAAES